ncbi:hypothetical protein GJ744_003070 [Endocarpon pusillum]|uniref:F-box domain-containing protein n=1 Tax=Endocarpon pusillum TaxID=364733 RepID=A0A8H7A854_9EURO|nr:hypothetical protein GJ744_003070 [Endocarpon pusillum]
MWSPSGPSSYFEHLPLELHRMILAFLPDFSSLHSVVIASRSAHDAYMLSTPSIQWSVMRRLFFIEPQLAAESRWLHAASYIRRNTPDWHDDMDGFLAYADSKFEKQCAKDPRETVTAEGLRFHIIVEDWASAFPKAVNNPNLTRSTGVSESSIWKIPLQLAKSVRIQRALYRFQRICQMYPRNVQHRGYDGRTQKEHPLGDFVRRLPSWELEELDCVYRYLISMVSFLDDPKYSSLVCAHGFENEILSYRYKERVISMGLIFLHKLVTAPLETRLALLEQYCHPQTPTLSDVLPLDGANKPACKRARDRLDRSRTTLTELPDWGYCFRKRPSEVLGCCKTENERLDTGSWLENICETGSTLQL